MCWSYSNEICKLGGKMENFMDWNVFWTAGGVVLALGSLIIACFKSLSKDIRVIDQRLSKLEGAFEERGRWESRSNK